MADLLRIAGTEFSIGQLVQVTDAHSVFRGEQGVIVRRCPLSSIKGLTLSVRLRSDVFMGFAPHQLASTAQGGSAVGGGMIVVCRLCGAEIELKPDSQQARAEGEDPRQQLRGHLAEEHLTALTWVVRKAGWLLDMFLFACPQEPERWRKNIDQVVTWLQEELMRTELDP